MCTPNGKAHPRVKKEKEKSSIVVHVEGHETSKDNLYELDFKVAHGHMRGM